MAFGKTATQKGFYVSGSVSGFASYAVDGNVSGTFSAGHCAVTDSTTTTPAWWMVDLASIYNILSVTIYRRTDIASGI